MCVCMCVCECMCVCVNAMLWQTEDEIRSFGAGVTDDVGVGNILFLTTDVAHQPSKLFVMKCLMSLLYTLNSIPK